MFARLVVVQGSPEQVDDAVKVINERAVPGARQIPGLSAAYWALDRSSGKAVTLTIYDTEDSLKASEQVARELRERSVAEIPGAQIVSVETYEIVGQI
jgi:hypothetical protein